jgi:hypothetical protein
MNEREQATDDVQRQDRRAFVRQHRTAIYGYPRHEHGPSLSVVYYVISETEGCDTGDDAGQLYVFARERHFPHRRQATSRSAPMRRLGRGDGAAQLSE